MHDAPPPPLDRQGIGRLLAGAQRSDITLNDAFLAELRALLPLFRSVAARASRLCGPAHRTPAQAGAPGRSLVCG
ncbi:hypothetical protein KRMM14A1004_52120 [Krasilnikovia sp. MM14-A1004]